MPVKKIDWKKPVVFENRSDKSLRVLATNVEGEYPVVLVDEAGFPYRAVLEGFTVGGRRLINQVEKTSRWAYVSQQDWLGRAYQIQVCPSKQKALRNNKETNVKFIRLDYEDGVLVGVEIEEISE